MGIAKMAMKMKMAMAMKAMKAMKMSAMKMKMKAMKVSKIAKGKRAKSTVFRGLKVKTSGGLKKSDLKKNNAWGAATSKARKALGIKGFCPVGGKTAKGKALYAKVKSFYKK